MEIDLDPLEGTPCRALAFIGQGAAGAVLKAEHRTLLRRVVVQGRFWVPAIGRREH